MDTTFFNPDDFTVEPYCDWCKATNVESNDYDHDWEEFACNVCGGRTEFSGDPTKPDVTRTKEPDLDSLLETVQDMRKIIKFMHPIVMSTQTDPKDVFGPLSVEDIA